MAERLLAPGVTEHRVALQFGEHEWRLGMVDQQPEQVGQGVAGVFQLGVAQKSRITRDIGQQQIAGLRSRHLRSSYAGK